METPRAAALLASFPSEPADVVPIRAADPEPARITLTADVAVEFQAASGDKKRPTFSIVGYTGAVMNVMGFYNPVIVDLTGLKAPSQTIPALRQHDPNRIVGQTDSIKIGENVALTGTVTGDNADAQEVVSQANNGFKWQASIGADPTRREFLESGKRATVNGREVAGPMVIVREANLYEISFVPLGADGQTSANVAASNPSGSHSGANAMDFNAWLQAKGFDPAAVNSNEQQRTFLKAQYDTEQAAAKGGGNGGGGGQQPPANNNPVQAAGGGNANGSQSIDEILAARQQENRRIEEITRISAEAMDANPTMATEIGKIAKDAITAKMAINDFQLAMLRLCRAPIGAPGIIKGDSRMTAKVIEAAVCISNRLDDIEKHYDERTLNLADDRFPNGMGLRDLLAVVAEQNGHANLGSTNYKALLRAAKGMDPRTGLRAEGYSTIDITGILSNIANKFLLVGFNAVEDGWRNIAAIRNVRDFKTVTSYALTGNMKYEKVGATGELKHATLGETSYTNKADTYGKIFGISRTDIINDDLSAISDVPKKLGRGAALSLNDIFWTTFLAGVAANFWSVGNANVSTGGGSALSSAGLTAAQKVFRKQTDPDGNPLGITPKHLLVPPELEVTADELMTSMLINTGGSSTTDKVPNRNIWGGKYQVTMSSYLSNTLFTGNSTTAWWLIADPADLATIEVAFLNGRDTPIVESADSEFDTLGVQMRAYHDFGVARQESRASVRSAGT